MRASDVFRVPSVWAPPMVIVAILVFVMTLVYFGSVVNRDVGSDTDSGHVNLGAELAAGLLGSPAVSDRLSLRPSTLRGAADRMDVDKEYAVVVIPPEFTSSVLALTGASRPPSQSTSPTVKVLTNPRAPASIATRETSTSTRR